MHKKNSKTTLELLHLPWSIILLLSSFLHAPVARSVSVTGSDSIAHARVSYPGYVVYIVYGKSGMPISSIVKIAKILSVLLQVVYKLTDFGYSKSYDQNSVCTSLVGTMQYVVS
jgi:hypothetical protein